MEACPQYNDKDDFVGPHAISQAILFNTMPAGQAIAGERLDALAGPGGIAACGNAQNCVKVCPKDIPLTDSIAKAGRATTVHTDQALVGAITFSDLKRVGADAFP
jgi:succinate dehydrogenase / fumarate reductase iron-sulfur subunit